MCTFEINKSIQEAQETYHVSLSEIAEQMFVSDTTLWKMRNGQARTPDKILALAKATKSPNPIQAYCYMDCPIGRQLEFVPLNSVDRNQVVMLFRAKVETDEFVQKLDEMAMVSMNKQNGLQYSPQEEESYFKGFHEMLDVIHCFKEIVYESIRIWGISRIIQEIKKHNLKCINKGYAIKEKSAL